MVDSPELTHLRWWQSIAVRSRWTIEERVDDAGSLHAGWPRADACPEQRALAVCRVTAPAVVLGSTQPEETIDRDRATTAGVAVVRRRSGGGSVLVTPGEPVWIDAWVPRGDPLWRDDVTRAFDWLGEAWAVALDRLGVTGASVHRGGLRACTPWASMICFGGVGAGEVLAPDGRKMVGLSQRRTREGAWFHSACVIRWDPSNLVDVLAFADADRHTVSVGMDAAAVGVADMLAPQGTGDPIDRAAVVAALIESLP